RRLPLPPQHSKPSHRSIPHRRAPLRFSPSSEPIRQVGGSRIELGLGGSLRRDPSWRRYSFITVLLPDCFPIFSHRCSDRRDFGWNKPDPETLRGDPEFKTNGQRGWGTPNREIPEAGLPGGTLRRLERRPKRQAWQAFLRSVRALRYTRSRCVSTSHVPEDA